MILALKKIIYRIQVYTTAVNIVMLEVRVAQDLHILQSARLRNIITFFEFSNATIIPSSQLAHLSAERLSHVREKFSPHARIHIYIYTSTYINSYIYIRHTHIYTNINQTHPARLK